MDSIFGLDNSREESKLILIPVPWEVTASYGKGTSCAPKNILKASQQVDLYNYVSRNFYDHGIYLEEENKKILSLNNHLNHKKIKKLKKSPLEVVKTNLIEEINSASEIINDIVYEKSINILKQNKYAAVIGGDHSSPYGLIRALCEKYVNKITILHIDAHHDLRDSYQGFKHSHASFIKNLIDLDFPPKNIISVGIRDYCEEEYLLAKNCPIIKTFYDKDIKKDYLS